MHNPKRWKARSISRSPSAPRSREVIGVGLKDAFRLFDQPEKQFSWWDYRLNAFERGWGCASTTSCCRRRSRRNARRARSIPAPRKLERPSDHAPVIAQLTL